jgi:hypothetical protein
MVAVDPIQMVAQINTEVRTQNLQTTHRERSRRPLKLLVLQLLITTTVQVETDNNNLKIVVL